MSEIAGFPNFEVEFNKDAQLVDAGQVTALLDFLQVNQANPVSDLFVFAHGWNNDMADARALNRDFFARVQAALASGVPTGLAARRFAVVTVLWPSKKYADSALIPGGAASLETSPEVAYVQAQLDGLKAVFPGPAASAKLDHAKELVPQLESRLSAQNEYADLLRGLMTRPRSKTEDAADDFFSMSGTEILDRLKSPVLVGAPAPVGDTGGAADLGSFLGNVASSVVTAADNFMNRTTAAASNLVNLTTYYQMKERAGDIGVTGLNPVLCQMRLKAPDVKIHLVGHSFGGRLVTACTDGADGQPLVKPNTLTLLQAAFSHNGFAQRFDGHNDGFFRRVVTEKKVAGPVLISCSILDKAVGLAYPLASRLAGQQASALGDANDVYGGIGRNGAQHAAEGECLDGQLLAVGSLYAFEPGRLYNLHADTIITGHSDICKDEVAYALLTAVAAA